MLEIIKQVENSALGKWLLSVYETTDTRVVKKRFITMSSHKFFWFFFLSILKQNKLNAIQIGIVRSEKSKLT